MALTLFTMWGAKSTLPPPLRFSSVTSTTVRTSSQNFLAFSFNPFATLVLNFKALSSGSSRLSNLNQEHPSKKLLFLVISLQDWSCDNFSHRNARVTKLRSHNYVYTIIRLTWQNFGGDVIGRNYGVVTFSSKWLSFKKA